MYFSLADVFFFLGGGCHIRVILHSSKYGKWLAELSAIGMLFFRTLVASPQQLRSDGSQRTVSCSKPTSVNSAAWKSKISDPYLFQMWESLLNFTGWHEDIPYFALLVGKSLEVTNYLRCKLLSAFIRIVNFNSSVDLSVFAMESATSYDFQHSLTCTEVFSSLASKILWSVFGVTLVLNIMAIPWSSSCRSMVVFWGRYSCMHILMCETRILWLPCGIIKDMEDHKC